MDVLSMKVLSKECQVNKGLICQLKRSEHKDNCHEVENYGQSDKRNSGRLDKTDGQDDLSHGDKSEISGQLLLKCSQSDKINCQRVKKATVDLETTFSPIRSRIKKGTVASLRDMFGKVDTEEVDIKSLKRLKNPPMKPLKSLTPIRSKKKNRSRGVQSIKCKLKQSLLKDFFQGQEDREKEFETSKDTAD